MTGVLCAMAGRSIVIDYTGSATVTVGYLNISGPGVNVDYYGFFQASFGSVTPTVWGTTGQTFRILDFLDNNAGTKLVVFAVNGYAPNSGWTTLNIAGTNFTRSSGSYGYNSDENFTQWFWSSATNPYGTTVGATKALTWS